MKRKPPKELVDQARAVVAGLEELAKPETPAPPVVFKTHGSPGNPYHRRDFGWQCGGGYAMVWASDVDYKIPTKGLSPHDRDKLADYLIAVGLCLKSMRPEV